MQDIKATKTEGNTEFERIRKMEILIRNESNRSLNQKTVDNY